MGWIQRGWWICSAAALLSCGCAQHWGWKHAQRDELATVADDDEATFTETTLVKHEEEAKPLQQPAAVAKSASADDEALIDDTLARLRTLPDMSPEKVDQIARELHDPARPIPHMVLEQYNAMAKFKQEQLQKQRAAAETAAAPKKSVPATEKPVETKPADSVAEKEAKPASATKVAAETKATETPSPASPSDAPAKQRSMLDRVRRARDGVKEPEEKGIFNGKVGANDAPRLERDQLAMHVANKLDAEAADANLSWDKRLAQTIAALEGQLKDSKLEAREASRLQTQLRFLYLAADRKEDALREIDGLDAYEQDYWRSQLHAMSVLLDADGTPVKGRRAAIALRPLREAVDHLAAGATLDVKNVALCKSVSIWGNYFEFEKYEFKPNQEVLLYFEVENFASEETTKGFATEFITSYELFDTAGQRVADQQFPVAQETCQNRRRDYFIRYHWHVPKNLSPGEYTLQLTVEDQKGHKFGQGSVKLKVRG
jgi:hypothetical protein